MMTVKLPGYKTLIPMLPWLCNSVQGTWPLGVSAPPSHLPDEEWSLV